MKQYQSIRINPIILFNNVPSKNCTKRFGVLVYEEIVVNIKQINTVMTKKLSFL